MTTAPPNHTIQLRQNKRLFVDLAIPRPPKENRFYVLMHGSISVVQGPNNEFRIYALKMADDHSYRFGNWLAEESIPVGFLAELRGVEPTGRNKQNVLNPKLNPTIRLKDWPDDTDPCVQARITLPRPRRIHYLGLGKAEILRSDLLIFPKPKISGLTVFEYAVPGSFEELQLRSLDGQRLFWRSSPPTEYPGCDARVASLHIFNAPSQPDAATVGHARDEFAKSTKLLGQPEVMFAGKPKDLGKQPDVPEGLSPYEVTPLSERAALLARLARFTRTACFGGSQSLNDDGCKSCCSAADGDRSEGG